MTRYALLASTALLAACAGTTQADPLLTPPVATEAAEAPAPAPAPVDQAAALKQFFEEYDQAELALSPISKSYRGIKDQDYGKLDEFGEAAAVKGRELDQRIADEMVRRFDRAGIR